MGETTRLHSSAAQTGEPRGFDDFDLLARSSFVRTLEVETLRRDNDLPSIAEARARVDQTYYEIFSKIKNDLSKKSIPPEFGIKNFGARGEQTYGISLQPEKIRVK